MSKLSTEGIVHTIQMPVNPTYMVISARIDKIRKELFIMTGITEKEYNKLKCNECLKIVRGEQKFNIEPDDVLCYGDIDFHEGSHDCIELDTFNWLDNLDAKGVAIPSKYNYNKHECISSIKSCMYTETFRNSTLCRYLHGRLGKPEFTLIFREIK